MSLQIGLLGASRIAPLALISPARDTGCARPVAVAARSLARANAFAAEHGVPRAVEGYRALFELPEVEAVYNSLPTSLHAELTLEALASGRHVLCEKPFAMNAAEARDMVAAAEARGLVLMEAFHYRHHPLFARILEVLADGRIGRLRRIEAVFHAPIPWVEGELRYDPALGGGALMDLGTYCVHWARTIAGSEPAVAWAEHVGTDSGVDLATRAELRFPGEVSARISCHMGEAFGAYVIVTGEAGSLTARNPLVPQYGNALTVVSHDGETREVAPLVSTYALQLQAFVTAIRTGAAPLTGGADAIAQMEAIEAIRSVSAAVDDAGFSRPRA